MADLSVSSDVSGACVFGTIWATKWLFWHFYHVFCSLAPLSIATKIGIEPVTTFDAVFHDLLHRADHFGIILFNHLSYFGILAAI